ncbi:type II toxin-antitoxin system YafQ family toxin [Campylobacter sp. 19-13652]|uniref:type II toxin-antitoxin system YafQ family toxin n=1 Tax=Campylobacter sp. 19-13652 TaxID=2840180 RepID=UPI001C7991B2|nr:type II toxin-antitoxin system YafQ family toxin [Campylobacter sp. 19-13652]BCX79252.1 addiction module toxin RelE [Campylobacter sp. 19-13652]
MIYKIKYSKKFKTSFKKLNIKSQELVYEVIYKLANDKPLETKHKDHALRGKYSGFRDCHVLPDLVLIYRKDKDVLELALANAGKHAEVFR